MDKTRTAAGFRDVIAKTLDNRDVRTLFILSCDANGFTPEEVDPVLKDIPVPVFGGIFPAIIYGTEKMEEGTIVLGLSREARTAVIQGLSDSESDYIRILDEQIPEAGNVKTMFVFVDGFAKRIGALISSLFNVFGLENNYIGGGAGSMSMLQKPCLFSNQGLLRDCAVLALLDIASGVGVSHGWESVSGPFRVTGSEQNRVITLDWRPAFEVYKEVVEDHAHQVIDKNNFFDIAKAFPFGITKLGAERVVRDPFMVGADNSLVCVGEVPEGTFVDILKGDEASLIAAAAKACLLSKEAFARPVENTMSIFMDCISRVLFLEERFSEELNSVYRQNENKPMIGACTIGEIANSGNDYLEFYNKTSVVALLEAL
jgi:hypothetical protein